MYAREMRPVATREELDAAVARVAAKKAAWIAVPRTERIAYLRRCLDAIGACAERWVEVGAMIKGGGAFAGEEWLAGPWPTARNVRLLIRALESGGTPPPAKSTTRADGRSVARVFPASAQDRLMFTGFSADVWIAPGEPATQGRIYRDITKGEGRVALVLGAGNVSSIAPMDVLYKLFVEDEVVVLKTHPVNAALAPVLAEALKPLLDDGFLAIVDGGADVGAYLAEHAGVDTLHVTGSDRTYDAIVWGADPAEQARRKLADDPKNVRPFTAELGCVTPVLVVPGPWSADDLAFQARQVASMVTHNASFNCNAAKVLVVARGWLQRDAFLRRVREELAKAPPRPAYYPGASDRYQAFLDAYPQADVVGARGEGGLPWTLIPDVPAKRGEYALSHEAFCGVLSVVTLAASDAAEFLARAVDFANDDCWGTLSCSLLVHPSTERDFGEAVDDAIARLRYGGIGINCWAGVVYALGSASWGAYPGHTPADIRSGSGVVHNAYLFDHPEKTVVRAPFRIRPTPAWFWTNASTVEIGRRLVRYETAPTWGNVASVAAAALRG
jgi:acyl-CoA reductase-like NAD-dependent aldehyde dehydrogenase